MGVYLAVELVFFVTATAEFKIVLIILSIYALTNINQMKNR